MARLTSDFRFHALRERSASRVVQKVNELLCERSRRGMFVTLLYGILHVPKRTLTYVNAGHIPPVLWNSRDGVVRVLPKAGDPPLGILRGRTFRSARLRLQEEDCLLLTTDGILDARNPRGEQFGWDRLQEAMRRGDGDARSVHRRILAELNRFLKGARLADDVTLVLMGVEPMSWT
jgi:sigma-B regulation protein RsbU (phosphoserine phosphatase)